MTKRELERELRRGARLVELVRENLDTVLVCLLACDERDLAERIAGTMGDALWRHDLTGDNARPIPELATFACALRAELATMGINTPDGLRAYVASLKRPT
jgi:hypothetical protein